MARMVSFRIAASIISRCICVPLVVVLILPLVLAITAIVLCFICVLSIMFLPLLLVSYLVVRILQLLTDGEVYYKVTNVKAIIRALMVVSMVFLLILLVIFYSLASTVSKVQHIKLYHLPVSNWILVTIIIIGLSALSCSVSSIVERLSPPALWQNERCVNVVQAGAEIIDCLSLWLSTTLSLNRIQRSFKQHHLPPLPNHKWIQGVIFSLIGIDTIAICFQLITYLLHKFYKGLSPELNEKSMRRFWVEDVLCREHAMYWVDGLRKSIIFIFGFMVLFLSWNSYCRIHLNATREDKKVVHFVTMAFVSLLLVAVFWLIKSCILLTWKANQVYAQLKPRLLENREELYFLGILGRQKFDFFRIGSSAEALERLGSIISAIACLKRSEHVEKFLLHPKVIKKVKNDLYIWEMKKDNVKEDDEKQKQVGAPEILSPTLHDLQQMAQYFLQAQSTLSSDKYVPEMLRYLASSAAERGSSLEEHLEELIKTDPNSQQVEDDSQNSQKEREWQWFKQLMDKQSQRLSSKGINKPPTSSSNEKREFGIPITERAPSSSNEKKEFDILITELDISITEPAPSSSNEKKEFDMPITEPENNERETLRAWLENARGTCMELANTLSSAEEVVNCLDNIISGLVIGATFIMWLLLTGLATTKILVLIASPLLATTFIFGDTCRSFFQGIIFVYAYRTFSVGDLVIVDGITMEVKVLGVWKTIFVEIGQADEIIYPNSELANKKIINYKSGFDWSDRLEFSLKPFESHEIKPVRKAIKEHLKEDERCLPNHISTEVLLKEEGVKVVVHLKYNIENQHGMTLYERLQKKRSLQSLFTVMIWDRLNQYKTNKHLLNRYKTNKHLLNRYKTNKHSPH